MFGGVSTPNTSRGRGRSEAETVSAKISTPGGKFHVEQKPEASSGKIN